ncbi:MAG: 4Fe-4S dicluster domain-containing protein [Methanobacteriota archaeon]
MADVPLSAFVQGFKQTLKQLLTKRPVTIHYPDEFRSVSDRLRARIEVDQDLCIGCTQCSQACPNGSCTMTPADEFKGPRNKRGIIPRVDVIRCMYCGLCEDVCPTTPKSIYLTRDFRLADYRRDIHDYTLREMFSGEGDVRLRRQHASRPEGARQGEE